MDQASTGRAADGAGTPSTTERRTIDRCANITCPNRAPHGMFDAVHLTHGSAVGGHRDVVVVLCSPCSTGLAAFEQGRRR